MDIADWALEMKQFALFECVKPFSFRVEGQRGPRINVKAGDIFWNTTPAHTIAKTSAASLARKGKNMGYAYPFSLETISEYFQILD
jgi:hypothetical protein